MFSASRNVQPPHVVIPVGYTLVQEPTDVPATTVLNGGHPAAIAMMPAFTAHPSSQAVHLVPLAHEVILTDGSAANVLCCRPCDPPIDMTATVDPSVSLNHDGGWSHAFVEPPSPIWGPHCSHPSSVASGADSSGPAKDTDPSDKATGGVTRRAATARTRGLVLRRLLGESDASIASSVQSRKAGTPCELNVYEKAARRIRRLPALAFKTVMCTDHQGPDGCDAGRFCCQAHSPEELRTLPQNEVDMLTTREAVAAFIVASAAKQPTPAAA